MTTTKNSMARANSNTLSGMKKDDLIGMLNTQKDSIHPLIPEWSELSPEYITTSTALLVLGDDKLQACSKKSLIGAMLKMAETGLRYSHDECYLIPYGGEIEFRISYKGMRKLAERSIHIKRIMARAVYEGDEFDYCYGINPDIKHKPLANGSRDWTKLTHTYAIAYLTNGGFEFEVISKEEIERRRLTNKFQQAQPSKNWALGYDTMAKSKAIRVLIDNLPLEQEIKMQIQKLDDVDLKPEYNFANAESKNKAENSKATEEADYTVEEEMSEEDELQAELNAINQEQQ